jgi:hypothetical protein
MLKLILALAAVFVVAASLAPRLSQVHAASNKPAIRGGPGPVSTGSNISTRSTATGKHIPTAILQVR